MPSPSPEITTKTTTAAVLDGLHDVFGSSSDQLLRAIQVRGYDITRHPHTNTPLSNFTDDLDEIDKHTWAVFALAGASTRTIMEHWDDVLDAVAKADEALVGGVQATAKCVKAIVAVSVTAGEMSRWVGVMTAMNWEARSDIATMLAGLEGQACEVGDAIGACKRMAESLDNMQAELVAMNGAETKKTGSSKEAVGQADDLVDHKEKQAPSNNIQALAPFSTAHRVASSGTPLPDSSKLVPYRPRTTEEGEVLSSSMSSSASSMSVLRLPPPEIKQLLSPPRSDCSSVAGSRLNNDSNHNDKPPPGSLSTATKITTKTSSIFRAPRPPAESASLSPGEDEEEEEVVAEDGSNSDGDDGAEPLMGGQEGKDKSKDGGRQ